MHLDVTSDADWVEAVGTATNRYGKLDILVNNAGIVLWKRLEETSEAEWDHLMAVNAKGVFLGTKHAIPALRRAGGGSIVNISSTAGLRGSPGLAAYIATKGAVRLLTKATALEHVKDNIRCNSVHPGGVDTHGPERLTTRRVRTHPQTSPGSSPMGSYPASDVILHDRVGAGDDGESQ
jgi:NAD(P)-dependent dehydrogenase (short-subunit alcohol dehydrogenase family)